RLPCPPIIGRGRHRLRRASAKAHQWPDRDASQPEFQGRVAPGRDGGVLAERRLSTGAVSAGSAGSLVPDHGSLDGSEVRAVYRGDAGDERQGGEAVEWTVRDAPRPVQRDGARIIEEPPERRLDL